MITYESKQMKIALINKTQSITKPKNTASVRIVLLVLVSFFLGVAATAFWFHRCGSTFSTNPSSGLTDEPSVGQPAPSSQLPPPVAIPQPLDPVIVAEVKQSVPNYQSISLAEGANILRTAALKDFATAVKEMDNQVAAAQQKLQDAQGGQSVDEQQSALKLLQDTQAAQAEKLKAVTARLQAQIAALKSLKDQ